MCMYVFAYNNRCLGHRFHCGRYEDWKIYLMISQSTTCTLAFENDSPW